MVQIAIETVAGRVTTELALHGVQPHMRVRILVDFDADEQDLAGLLQSGGAFDWLAVEPDLYNDSDLKTGD